MAIKKRRSPEGSRIYDRLCVVLLLLLFSAGPAIADPQHHLDITFASTHPPSLPDDGRMGFPQTSSFVARQDSLCR